MDKLKLIANNQIVEEDHFIFRGNTIEPLLKHIVFDCYIRGNSIDIKADDNSRSYFTCFNQNEYIELVREEIYFIINEGLAVELPDSLKLKYSSSHVNII